MAVPVSLELVSKNDLNLCCDSFLGCETVEHWCKDSSGIHIPSHFYIIIRHAEKEVFSAMLPWRSEDVNDNCRIANQDECRAVYHGDFSCESGKDLSLDWWAEQMDLHSVKVTEIEKLSNLKERIYHFNSSIFLICLGLDLVRVNLFRVIFYILKSFSNKNQYQQVLRLYCEHI